MVKRATGALIQAVDLHAPGGGTRRAQVYQAIADAIVQGRLAAGSRLPSARQLALEWQVARGVVDEAFARLQDEGLIVRRVGDGSYVNHPPRARAPAPVLLREPTPAAQRVLQAFAPMLAHSRLLHTVRRQFDGAPMHPREWPLADFPIEPWRRCCRQSWSDEWLSHMGYGPAAGVPELRRALARHVALNRSLPCKPEQIIVTNGPMQGIELVARVLLQPGDAAWVEDPGHPSLPLLLEMLHLKAVGVPLDEQGLMVSSGRARAPHARFVYTHPLTQYPLGLRTSARRQDELLQWAEESGAWILEGMFNDEIVHRPPAPPALAARDRQGCVVMMGTLEGVMFPALRIAYLVVPERLIDVFTAARGMIGDHNATAPQIALAQFIDEGHLNDYLRTLARRCGERRRALHEAVTELLPATVRLSPTDTGIHACLHLPPQWDDATVMETLRKRRVGSEALSVRCWQARGLNGLVMSYGAASPAAIRSAIATVAQVLSEERR